MLLQSPANGPVCSHQSSDALLCVSREAPASHSEQLLEFSYIPAFHIASCRLSRKTLHKALSLSRSAYPKHNICNLNPIKSTKTNAALFCSFLFKKNSQQENYFLQQTTTILFLNAVFSQLQLSLV